MAIVLRVAVSPGDIPLNALVPRRSANLCRLFSKAGDMLVEDAGDDIRVSVFFLTFLKHLPIWIFSLNLAIVFCVFLKGVVAALVLKRSF